MLPVFVNKECTIINGSLQGVSGVVVAFDYLENEVIVKIDQGVSVITCHENIQQEH